MLDKIERLSYVYIYIRLDNNTIFYVGKGKNDRYKKTTDRNDHFKKIINKVPYRVEILKDNLTEEQSFQLEKEIIHYLVFNEGYGIDIDGYRKPNEIKHLCNATFGGEGTSGYKHTEEWKQQHGERMSGENHWNYGNPNNFHHTEESKTKMSKTRKGKLKSEEWKEKISKAHQGKTLSDKTRTKMSKTRIESEVAKGKNNPMAKSVICFIDNKPFMIFDYIQQAMEYFNIKGSSSIGNCCKGKSKSCGKHNGKKIVWKFLFVEEL